MDRLTLLVLFTFFVGLSGTITDECLDAICQVESGCQALNCTEDGACGYYQITAPYYIDCGRPGDDLESCSMDKDCSDGCVRKYMERYGEYCTGHARTPKCQDYARIHHGGPLGCLKSSTKDYWTKIDAVLS